MTYARRQPIGTNRTIAVIIVALVHALLGYFIVTGLAYSVLQKAAADLKTFDVVLDEPPPPEEEPPPPPQPVPESQPPPVVSPPPIVRAKPSPPRVQTVRQAPPPVVTPTAPAAPPAPVTLPAPPPPPPPPVETVPPRSAVGDLQGLFRGDDYPVRAIERDEQGSVTVRLTIGTHGRVSSCNVTSSSGSRALDNETCRILQTRAKFNPARDNRGNLTTDTVSQRIRWVLEG